MRALVAALLLAACAPLTRYNVAVSADRGVPLRLEEIDHEIEALDFAFASAGLLELGTTEEIVSGSWVDLRWFPSIPFRCDLPASGGMGPVYGCSIGSEVEVGSAKCMADTALLHELTHLVLGRHNSPSPTIRGGQVSTIVDSDPNHIQSEWWDAQRAADRSLRRECE